MANNTGWSPGRLFSDAAWHAAFNAADLNSLASTDSVLSSVTAFDNGTAQDQLMDISFKLTIASSAVAANANIALYIAMLQEDGSTLGDGLLTAGTGAAVVPAWSPVRAIPLYASTRTSLVGGELFIPMPFGSFALILANNSGFALASSGNACSIRTYNQGLND